MVGGHRETLVQCVMRQGLELQSPYLILPHYPMGAGLQFGSVLTFTSSLLWEQWLRDHVTAAARAHALRQR